MRDLPELFSGMVIISAKRRGENLSKSYFIGYEKEYHEKAHEGRIKHELIFKLEAERSRKEYFENIAPDASILDYGGGMGQNVFLMKNAIVYDISAFAITFCRKKGMKATDDLELIPNGSLDIVICSHVLEHVKEPINLLQTIKSKLKTDGKAIIVLPVEKPSYSDFEPDADQHLYAWNFRTINNLLMKNNFKIEKNKFLYINTGLKKLLFLAKLNFRLYYFFTYIIGRLLDSREMVIVARKVV